MHKSYKYYLPERNSKKSCGVLVSHSFAPNNKYSEWAYDKFLEHLGVEALKKPEMESLIELLKKNPWFCQYKNFGYYYERESSIEGFSEGRVENVLDFDGVVSKKWFLKTLIWNYLVYKIYYGDSRISLHQMKEFTKAMKQWQKKERRKDTKEETSSK